MNLGLKGRIAMVAAASKGIGRASAVALAKEGCRVSICARSQESLADASREIELHGPVLASKVDVGVREDLERWYQETVGRFGKVDILVTNTGGPPVSRFAELSDEQWKMGVESTL
ncbi:MAG: SDR family NAD(P)-dependent oxidoreductase, partial [Acidobacteriota bacterium]